MNPIMNNTKWRECITLLASHGVYLQLQLVGEADFPSIMKPQIKCYRILRLQIVCLCSGALATNLFMRLGSPKHCFLRGCLMPMHLP